MEHLKKRKREHDEEPEENDEEEEEILSDVDEDEHVQEENKVNLPRKSKYRMRAHCNPLSCISITYPYSPLAIDWSIHYPVLYGKSTRQNSEVYNNTGKFPIEYSNANSTPVATCNPPQEFLMNKNVTILDVGCGYGGLLFNMTSSLANDELALGMEIRDKVSNYVAEKVKSLRINSNHTAFNNIAVIRTNTMKLLLNYFYKGQLERIFFCFPDPHFKKYNHRKRIINTYLINDYAYVLKVGGRLYTITDVEDLHMWHVKTITQCPCFRQLSEDEITSDKFLPFMKNTDEARKVQKKKGKMFYAVYERVKSEISSISALYKILKGNNL